MRPVFLFMAVRNLGRHARRSLMTFMAISLGLGGLVFLTGYVEGINRQTVNNITGYLTGHLQVHRRGYHDDPKLTRALSASAGNLRRLSRQPLIAEISPRVEGDALASSERKTRGMRVIGVDPPREIRVTTLSRAMVRGQYLDAGDRQGVILGDQAAEVLQVDVGGEVALVTQAADGSIGAGRYRVRGIFRSGIDLLDTRLVFMTLPAAQELYVLEGRMTTLALRLSDADAAARTAQALQRELGARHEVLDWKALMPDLADHVAFHETLVNIILFVVFVIVTLGIANTVLIAVMERTREFGVMMALGNTPAEVARIVVYEALLLGGAGVVFGLIGGYGVVGFFGHRGIDLGQYTSALQMMPGLTGIVYPEVTLAQLLHLAVVTFITTVLASLYPAWKAAGLSPIEAMRGWRQILSLRLAGWSLPVPSRAVFARIALRGIARNPRRSVLTIGALAAGLAGYLFLSALGQGFHVQMRDNSTNLLTGHVQIEPRDFRREYDAKLTLSGSPSLLARVRGMPAVAGASPRLQSMAMISSPTRTEPVLLNGVDPAAEARVTRLHEHVRQGRYLNAGDTREVVIGRELARRLDVRLGEKLVLMAPAADGSLGSTALRVSGIFATDNDMLDRRLAVTNLASARELLGVRRDVSTIAVRLKDIADADRVAAEIGAGLETPGQQAVTWKVLMPEVVQMLEFIQVNLFVILLVVFAVVAIGVTNTLLMAVLERTREFGLQLALGTLPRQIVRTVFYESLVLSVLGLVAGLAVGGLIVEYYRATGFDLGAYASGMRSMPGMTSVVYPQIVATDTWLPMAALFVTGVIVAIYPAWRASRLDPVVAMRMT